MPGQIDLTILLRRMVREHGTQQGLAKHLGVSPQYLNDVLRGKRAVSAQLAERLGYERRIVYIKKEGDNHG